MTEILSLSLLRNATIYMELNIRGEERNRDKNTIHARDGPIIHEEKTKR